MEAVFIELPAFARYRQDYLDDDAFRALQKQLMLNPALRSKWIKDQYGSWINRVRVD